jgi:hypothetical protein
MFTDLPAFAGPILVVLHGLGHGGALIALAWIAARPGTDTGAWTAARSWALPNLAPALARLVAGTLWAIALVTFVVAGAGMAGVGGGSETWRPLALVGAVTSLSGIGLFLGTWPVFNTVAAIAVDAWVLGLALQAW